VSERLLTGRQTFYIFVYFLAEDLPLFPISERFMGAVRERVNLARDLDKEELKLKRVQSERGWMKKHAEEMDMIIDGYNDES